MFDPYHKWLGIPPKDQPPNHYRLLGIDLSESDPDVIEAAANRQMAYLQGCAAGPHVAWAHKLLEEIAAARRCLLSPPEKAEYDAKLKANVPSVPLELPGLAAPSGSAQGAVTAEIPAPPTPLASDQDWDWYDGLANKPGGPNLDIRQPQKRWIVGIAILSICGLVFVAILGVWLLAPSGWVTGQDKDRDGPTGLEGSWQMVKFKTGDGEWEEPTKGELWIKHITQTHHVFLRVNVESKQANTGGGGRNTIKGESYKEEVTYGIGEDKSGPGRMINYTWQFKGEELHMSGTEGKTEFKQIWRRLAK